MPTFSSRSHQTEELDNLTLKGDALRETLDSLGKINTLFGNHRAILWGIQRLLDKIAVSQPLTVVDIGCGGGDVIGRVAKFLRKQGIKADLIGIDGNPHSLTYARERNQGYPELTFHTKDLLDKSFQLPPCDILISSHFLYHFPDQQLIEFLNHAQEKVRIGCVFSELDRNPLAYRLFPVGSFLLGFNGMIRRDGQLAIQRAFRKKELVDILEKAHIYPYQLHYLRLFRHLLILDFTNTP